MLILRWFISFCFHEFQPDYDMEFNLKPSIVTSHLPEWVFYFGHQSEPPFNPPVTHDGSKNSKTDTVGDGWKPRRPPNSTLFPIFHDGFRTVTCYSRNSLPTLDCSRLLALTRGMNWRIIGSWHRRHFYYGGRVDSRWSR